MADPLYLSARWRRLRSSWLRRSPVCDLCGEVATLIHHKVPVKDGGDAFAVENLQSLCQGCHNRIHGTGGAEIFPVSSEITGRIESETMHGQNQV